MTVNLPFQGRCPPWFWRCRQLWLHHLAACPLLAPCMGNCLFLFGKGRQVVWQGNATAFGSQNYLTNVSGESTMSFVIPSTSPLWNANTIYNLYFLVNSKMVILSPFFSPEGGLLHCPFPIRCPHHSVGPWFDPGGKLAWNWVFHHSPVGTPAPPESLEGCCRPNLLFS